jgi:hypothetical protein
MFWNNKIINIECYTLIIKMFNSYYLNCIKYNKITMKKNIIIKNTNVEGIIL